MRTAAGWRCGVIVPMAYMVVALLMALGSALLVRSVTEERLASRAIDRKASFSVAEAAVDRGLRWFRTQGASPGGTAPFDPFGGAQAFGDGTYAVTIDPDDANPTAFVDRYTMTVTSTVEGDPATTRRLSVILQTESFARYAYFTNFERTAGGSQLWFTSSDHLRGPMYTNDQLSVAGSPVFDGAVYTGAGSIAYKNPAPTGGNHPQFNGGLALKAATVAMPASLAPLRIAAASAGGQWYEGNTTLTFAVSAGACGAVPPPCALVTNIVKGWANKPQPLPASGAIFVNGGNAFVSGTVDGQVSVGSSADVVLSNNVLCADNPESNSASNDVIGLLAERNVVVPATAPTNLTVQASVMALNESFTVENWWVGPAKGTLKVYGGIAQKRRGPVGTFNGSTGQKMSGYSKDYWYDGRLFSTSPPYYPTTGVYQTVLWQENN